MAKLAHPATVLGLCALFATGCSTVGESLGFAPPVYPLTKEARAVRDSAPVPAPVPRELAMGLHPPHVVGPGDTLLVQPVEFDAPVRLPPDQPVQPDGTIDLGPYGRPVVAGKTLAEVEAVVRDAIRAKEKDAKEAAIAVTVRLIGKQGKVFYVLGEVNAPGAFPVTGQDTVLSAITQAGGPTRTASWDNAVLARPSPPDGCRVVLPICYTKIVQLGDTTTNYQLLPGDRIYVPSRGTTEGMFPAKCQKPNAACARPQFSCFGGGCAPAAAGTPLPAIPAAPPALP